MIYYHHSHDLWPLRHKVTFDGILRLIYINFGESTIDVKIDLYSDWKEWIQLRDYSKFLPAFRTIGGDPINVAKGIYAGDTYFLVNNWRIIIEHATELIGILYTEESVTPYVIKERGGISATVSNLVQTIKTNVAAATSAADVKAEFTNEITTLNAVSAHVKNIKPLIEGLRPGHTGYGNIWYWDPIGGSDQNNGTTPTTAFATFAKAHDVCIAWNHDVIYAWAGPTLQNPTVSTETIILSKAYTFLRGPGLAFILSPSDTANNAITITGQGCQVEKFRIANCPQNISSAISIEASSVNIQRVMIENMGNGVTIGSNTALYNTSIDECYIKGNNGHGIKINDFVNHCTIGASFVSLNTGSGIVIDNLTGSDVIIEAKMEIQGNGGYGIDIVNGYRTIVHGDVHVFANTLGDINDLGIGTYMEETENQNLTASAVWNRPAANYNVLDSFGAKVNSMSDSAAAIAQLSIDVAALPTSAHNADAVRTNLAAELGKINSQVDGLTSTQIAMLTSMYELLGLDPTKPLTVTPTSVSVGTIHQNITGTDTATTVTRV